MLRDLFFLEWWLSLMRTLYEVWFPALPTLRQCERLSFSSLGALLKGDAKTMSSLNRNYGLNHRRGHQVIWRTTISRTQSKSHVPLHWALQGLQATFCELNGCRALYHPSFTQPHKPLHTITKRLRKLSTLTSQRPSQLGLWPNERCNIHERHRLCSKRMLHMLQPLSENIGTKRNKDKLFVKSENVSQTVSDCRNVHSLSRAAINSSTHFLPLSLCSAQASTRLDTLSQRLETQARKEL